MPLHRMEDLATMSLLCCSALAMSDFRLLLRCWGFQGAGIGCRGTFLDIGDAARATQMADALLKKGIYVIGFSYPVVPQGKARIRVQISAAHTRADLEFAVKSFKEVWDAMA